MVPEPDESPELNAEDLQNELLREALASGTRNYEEAGNYAGMSARTVRRRMADAAFRSSVLALTAERNRQMSSLLAEGSVGATRRLIELTNHPDPRVALRAIQILLSNNSRALREVEMQERIAALEARFEAESEGGEGS